MPRHVDHDQRRHQVAEVAARLVASEGRRALTVRRVAAAAGYSTTIVSHYFDDTSELLHETYALAARRSRARVDAVLDADPSDVIGLAEALLPLDEARAADWRIWLAFWGEALGSVELAAEQRRRARTSADRFRRSLEQLVATGRAPADLDVRSTGDRLAALILGIAGEAVFDPEKWTPSCQRGAIIHAVRSAGVVVDDADRSGIASSTVPT